MTVTVAQSAADLNREPTPDEKRNGWTKESLAAYLTERSGQQHDYAKQIAQSPSANLQVENTRQFNPHDWL